MAGAMVGDFDSRSLRVAGGYRVGSEGASNRVPGASTDARFRWTADVSGAAHQW
jgi:hypothetical protein